MAQDNNSSTLSRSSRLVRRFAVSTLAAVLGLGGLTTLEATSAGALSSQMQWKMVANLNTVAPGTSSTFNSFSQPSIDSSGLVTFRGRTTGSSGARGIFTEDMASAQPTVSLVAKVGDAVPAPNNNGGTFNEFPSFPRIGVTGGVIATVGQSTPVWSYTVDNVSSTAGTAGVYATQGGQLTTVASLLGAVPGMDVYSVPGATAGTKFDQFPSAPAVDGNYIAFKGNYTDGTTSGTGVFYRDASQPTSNTQLIANINTLIPGQSTVTFGATAGPSAADGHLVFTGWDNEAAPTMGGIYLAPIAPSPTLTPLVSIGDQVPGQAAGDTFANFGEALSFDGRFVAFWGTWGTETRTITLTCPTDGAASLVTYCLQQYPNGFTTTVPVHQGMFVYDTVTSTDYAIAVTGDRFSNFKYWTYSGIVPGVGGSTDGSSEYAAWRSSSFMAVSGESNGNFQVAFKGDALTGDSAIFLAQGPSTQSRVLIAVRTQDLATSIDPAAPAGAEVTGVSIERDGFRGRWLAIGATMLDPATSASWAGLYAAQVPSNLAKENQTLTTPTVPPAYVGGHHDIGATSSSFLPVTYSIAASSEAGVCSMTGSTVNYENAGRCVVDVAQTGDDAYNAVSTQLTIDVSLMPQVISSPTPPQAYVTHTYDLAATSTSGLPVTYTLDATSEAGVCELNGSTLSYLAVGLCAVDVNQAGDTTYAPAEQFQLFIEVALHPQVISTGTIPAATLGGSVTLTATSDSGLPVVYSVSTLSGAGVCTLEGAVVTFNTTGTCVIEVNQPGDTTYAPAPMVRITFYVGVTPPPGGGGGTTDLIPQTITVGTLPSPTVGDIYELNATASSGLPVSYSIDPSSASVCSLTGTTISFISAGTCVVIFTQAGDTVYQPVQISQTIVVAGFGVTMKMTVARVRAVFGQVTTATATVSTTSGPAVGSVQFAVNGTNIGEAQALVEGSATSPPLRNVNGTALNPGTHAITATFIPTDAAQYSSAKATGVHTVTKAATRLTLNATRTTLKVRALTKAPGQAVATGKVIFRVNNKVLGRVALKNRVATLRVRLTANQRIRVVAIYRGDARVSGSVLNRVIVVH